MARQHQYHPASLLDTIDSLYERYNQLILKNGYDVQYHPGKVQMFSIDGMKRVREIIEKNRQNKITKHKKVPNNTILEIDHCSPIELLNLQSRLVTIANGEGTML